jgi:hypothetical protein
MHEIFISYASADQAIANRVVRGLEQHGLSCWISSREIKPGADYQASIAAAIEACMAVVVLFSRKSLASSEVPKEMSLAGASRKLLIPLRLENIEPAGAFRYQLANAQYVDVFEDFDGRLHELCLHLDETCRLSGEVAQNVRAAARRRAVRSWAGRAGLAVCATLAAMLAWKAAPALHAALDRPAPWVTETADAVRPLPPADIAAGRPTLASLPVSVPRPTVTEPPASVPATPEENARAFAVHYYDMIGAPAGQGLAFLAGAVADPVHYYGKSMSRSSFLQTLRGYFERWPERHLTVRAGSLTAVCGYGTGICQVAGIIDIDLKSTARNAGSSVAERFAMQLSGAGRSPVVTGISSTPVARRSYELSSGSAVPQNISLPQVGTY